MMSRVPLPASMLRPTLLSGGFAGLLSTAALAWRGQRELRRPAAPLNAPSHWLWGRSALSANRLDLRHTFTGQLIHHGSSLLWAGLYGWLRHRRRHPSPWNAVADAAAVTALAAVVDLRATPERLTPGFERRLSTRGLGWVYCSFGLGLALGGLAALPAALRR